VSSSTTPSLYPLWIRAWHAAQGLVFLGLVVTGLSLHYAGRAPALLPFPDAVRWHNLLGITAAGLYGLFLVVNVLSANRKHYFRWHPGLIRDAIAQMWFYTWDVFTKPQPFARTAERKLNPAQQLTYVGTMYVVVPAVVVTGVMLLFPEHAPEQVAGAGGLWPAAIVHLGASYALSVFCVLHVYLATTGKRASTHFREILVGDASDPEDA
jgi:thiosulfate reductase cytochrome b subunit